MHIFCYSKKKTQRLLSHVTSAIFSSIVILLRYIVVELLSNYNLFILDIFYAVVLNIKNHKETLLT